MTRWNRIRKFWSRLWSKYGPRYRVEIFHEEPPVKLKRRVVYSVLSEGYPFYATMICPCGCGDLIDLNMMEDEHPCWNLIAADGARPELHPSVRRVEGCYAHYWVRKGRVIWCADSGHQLTGSVDRRFAARR